MGLKKLFIISSLGFVLSMALSVSVLASSLPTLASGSNHNFHDPDVPIPLTDPLPFPWGSIEGIWQGQVAGRASLFSFEVQSEAGSRKVLKVFEINSETGEVVAQGTALSDDNSDEVRAGMVGRSGSYLLFVGLFEDKGSGIGSSKRVTVLRMRGFHESSSGTEQSLIIRKVSEAPIKAPSH